MDRFRRGTLVFDVADSRPADGTAVVLLHGHVAQLLADWFVEHT